MGRFKKFGRAEMQEFREVLERRPVEFQRKVCRTI